MNDFLSKAVDDRRRMIKAREDQELALRDSVQHLRDESLIKYNKNEKLLAEFRKMIPAANDELLVKTDELVQKLNEMKIRLDEYKQKSRGEWVSFKHEYVYKMNEFEKSVITLTNNNQA